MTKERTRIPLITSGFILALVGYAINGKLEFVPKCLVLLAIVIAALIGIIWIIFAWRSFNVMEDRITYLYDKMGITKEERWKIDYFRENEPVFHRTVQHWVMGIIIVVSAAVVGFIAIQ